MTPVPGALAPPLSFSLLGRRVRLGRSTRALRSLLAYHYHRPAIARAERGTGIALSVRPGPRVPRALQDRLPDTAAGSSAATQPVWRQEDEACSLVLLGDRAEGVMLRLRPSGAQVHAWGRLEVEGPGQLQLLLALQEALLASGLVPLHCAAAVAPGERGATAFLAPSGVGKSSTVVRAARAGWDPVCEDVAWYDPDSARLFGWDLELRLLPDVVGELGQVTSEPVPGETKRAVPFAEIERLFGVRRRTEVPLERVVLLRRGGGSSHWEPLERVVAVSALWEAVGLPLTQRVRDQVALRVARLSAQVPLATLWLAASPEPMPAPPERAVRR